MNTLDTWYKLDNTAKLFPAITTRRNSSTFRISMNLMENVDPTLLQEAVDLVIKRFPMFSVRMRRGFFWYFLETNDEKLMVYKEEDAPCSRINRFLNNEYLLRVLYFNKKISVEFFHSITDALGALEFIKLLVMEYLKLRGINIDSQNRTLSLDDLPSTYETEDSFKNYFKSGKTNSDKESKAYKIKGTNFNNFGNNVIKIVMDLDDIKALSKKYNVTITQYITGLFSYSIQKEKIKSTTNKNPINIFVPVNLKKFFPSKTLRNFFSVITTSIGYDREVSLAEILKDISAQFKSKLTKEKLQDDISSNYKTERVLYIRIAPLFIKNLFLRLAFDSGTRLQTTTVSNIGRINLPDDMKELVDHMEVVVYSSRINVINCAICSVNDKFIITFSRTILEPVIIKNFVQHLAETENIEMKLFSNGWGLDNE